jgi:hypothetical protein
VVQIFCIAFILFYLFYFRPCILIFDSLGESNRQNRPDVGTTLRKYLNMESKGKKTFTKKTIPEISPKMPVQPNTSDCGIYVLQYIESFFLLRLKYIFICRQEKDVLYEGVAFVQSKITLHYLVKERCVCTCAHPYAHAPSW